MTEPARSPTPRPGSTQPPVVTTAVTAVAVAAGFGAGWWLFTFFGHAFFVGDTAIVAIAATGAGLAVALAFATAGIARGHYYSWLAALFSCAVTVGASLTDFAIRTSPANFDHIGLWLFMLSPNVVSIAAIGILWLPRVRSWCTVDSDPRWLFPSVVVVIASAVGAVFNGYPINVFMAAGLTVAVLFGLVSFAFTRSVRAET